LSAPPVADANTGASGSTVPGRSAVSHAAIPAGSGTRDTLLPYEVGGELLLGSSIPLSLPEAGEYEVRVAEKQRAATTTNATTAPLHHDKALAFIASVPAGRRTACVDVLELV
jgi:hypothetical protein